MGAIHAQKYANVTKGCQEINVWSIICQSQALDCWFRFLSNYQVLPKVNFVKLDHLLSILNQINNSRKSTMEKSQTKLPVFRYNNKQKQ